MLCLRPALRTTGLAGLPKPAAAATNTALNRLLAARLSTTTAPLPPGPDLAPPAPPRQQATAAIRPYRVTRSTALNLPVYHRYKSGRTNKTTEVKKIEGDARVLARQLGEELGLETKVNPRTNHVIVKVRCSLPFFFHAHTHIYISLYDLLRGRLLIVSVLVMRRACTKRK